MNDLILDLTQFSSNLLTGRKNGTRAREKFNVKKADKYIFRLRSDQLVTSSYFLGLLGEEIKSFPNSTQALEHIDLDSLNDSSKNECIRAIKRGLSTSKGLI
ncbi:MULTISPECIES: hypothetical protein [Pseudoalteromonas]|uniref:hypothetical protein n=1 Tax=Pseudoalteromonas TaxID=53246 RepID=UPI000369F2DB|nr:MULTISPECIES: hypothetical protein [Pseudoalteromonas]